jgi:hypothetical protein
MSRRSGAPRGILSRVESGTRSVAYVADLLDRRQPSKAIGLRARFNCLPDLVSWRAVRGRRHRPPWGNCTNPCAFFHLRAEIGPITARASIYRILLDCPAGNASVDCTAGHASFHAEILTGQPSHIGNFWTARLSLHLRVPQTVCRAAVRENPRVEIAAIAIRVRPWLVRLIIGVQAPIPGDAAPSVPFLRHTLQAAERPKIFTFVSPDRCG